eukprot:2742495-Amphidinium_carterae.2
MKSGTLNKSCNQKLRAARTSTTLPNTSSEQSELHPRMRTHTSFVQLQLLVLFMQGNHFQHLPISSCSRSPALSWSLTSTVEPASSP